MRKRAIQLARLLFVLALLLGFAPGAQAKEYPLFVSIYDFSPVKRWDAVRITELKVVPDTEFQVDRRGRAERALRLETFDWQIVAEFEISHPVRPRPVSLLADLQRLALLEMLRDGYISKGLYDAVIDAVGTWEPEQVRYAVVWSPMTLDEARELFEGSVPWDRVMDARPRRGPASGPFEPEDVWKWDRTWGRDRPLRIVRSSVMMGMGQALDERTGRLVELPMAWQKAEAHASVSRVPREALPLVAEFSRAVAESGPLPGNLKLPLTALFRLLNEEARILGHSPDRYGLFARALSPQRARYFLRGFGMRVWDEAMRDWFATRPEQALAGFVAAETPRDLPEQSIAFTTLGSINARLPSDLLSQRAHRVREISGYRLSPAQAKRLLDRANEVVWHYLWFPEITEQRGPVCLWDSSALPAAFLAGEVSDLGLDDDAAANAVVQYLLKLPRWEPNVMTSYWREPGFVVPKEQPRRGSSAISLRVDNVSPEAVAAHPGAFLAGVLLSAYDYHRARLLSASPVVGGNVYLAIRQLAGESMEEAARRIDERTLTLDDVFEFPIVVGTTSRELSSALVDLGGKLEEGTVVSFPRLLPAFTSWEPLPLFHDASASPPGFLARFGPASLEALRDRFPGHSTENRCADHMLRLLALRLSSHL